MDKSEKYLCTGEMIINVQVCSLFVSRNFSTPSLPYPTPTSTSTLQIPMAIFLPLRSILESTGFNISKAFNITVTQVLQLGGVSRNDYWQLTTSYGVPYNVQSMMDRVTLERNAQRLGTVKEHILDMSAFNITVMLIAIVPTQGNHSF